MASRRSATLACLLAIAATTIAAITACRQIVGIGDQPPGADDVVDASDARQDAARPPVEASVCAPSADPCRGCMGHSCCKQTAACEADANCKHSLDCVLACQPGDETCTTTCVQDFGPLLAEALSCRAASCAPACNLSCGGVFGILYPLAMTSGGRDCGTCSAMQTKVCDDLTKCAADPACLEYAACQQRVCSRFDRACFSACRVSAAAGSSPGDALWGDVIGACAPSCRFGSDWSCLGAWSWPTDPRQSEQVDVAFRLKDAVTLSPLSGVTVQSCPVSLGTACPLDAGLPLTVSDDGGFVQVAATVATHSVDDYWQVTGGGVYPTLFFLSPPLNGALAGDATYAPWEFYAATNADVAFLPLPLDPKKGHISVLQYDCQWVPGPGLTVTLSPPSAGSTTTYPLGYGSATDVRGTAIIYNVDPNPGVTVIVSRQADGQVVGKTTLPVRPQTVTSVLLAPLPQ